MTFFEATKFQYSKFKKIKVFLPHSCSNVSLILWYHELDSIFMIALISSKKLEGCNNMRHPVDFVMDPMDPMDQLTFKVVT